MSALHEIQKKLKVGKENKNTFGNYSYRNCSDILEAVKPLLPDGFYISITDDVVLIGDRYYVKATAVLSDGQTTFSTTAYARESFAKKGMDDSQVTGSTSSYARKYALNGLFAIDDTKDADGMDNRKHETTKDAPKNGLDNIPDDKSVNADIVYKFTDTITVIKENLKGLTARTLEGVDLTTAIEAWGELTNEEKSAVWSAFDSAERACMKSNEWKLQSGKGE